MRHEANIFERRIDILIYLANATKPVTTNDILEDVTELDKNATNRLLKQFSQWGYVNTQRKWGGSLHSATQRTIDIFGRKN